MDKSIIIVEDFYDDPLAVREMALSLQYPVAGEGSTYPGKNSAVPILLPEAHTKLQEILGSNIAGTPDMANGFFRISEQNDSHKQDIHIDPGSDWAAVWFGNLPQDCKGGTYFWQHKKYGFEWCPRTPEEGKRYGFNTYEEIREKIIYGDGLNRDLWNLTMAVPMRFNRLVLFRPWMWHSHGKNFGNSIQNSRLVQLFFLKNIEQPSVKLEPNEHMIHLFEKHRRESAAPKKDMFEGQEIHSVENYFYMRGNNV